MKLRLPNPPLYRKPKYRITYIPNVGWISKLYHRSDIRQELIKWSYDF